MKKITHRAGDSANSRIDVGSHTGTEVGVVDRRALLLAGALSFGSLSLRSMITGLPTAFLLSKGETSWAAAQSAKYLILSHMDGGDPLNVNVPGTYGNPNDLSDPLHQIQHPTVAQLGDLALGYEQPTAFTLGATSVLAASPWSALPSGLLSRSAFWHHATYTNAHPDMNSVLALGGALTGVTSGVEHLGAFIAQENQANLGTVSSDLMRVGGSVTLSNGVPATLLQPTQLKQVFASKVSQFDRMVNMRDQVVDQVYQNVKVGGTPAQKKFMDQYTLSNQQARTLGDQLASLITDISSNAPTDQARMAAALISLKVTPVVTLGMPFGGDNHDDTDLSDEVSQTQISLNAFTALWDKLTLGGIQDQVVFASLNVFGRTLRRASTGGRSHNGSHHCLYVFGSSINPGVVGGLERYQRTKTEIDFRSKAISSSTGGTSNPDIPYEQTLASVGKTLAAAVGVSPAIIDSRIGTGKIITGALL